MNANNEYTQIIKKHRAGEIYITKMLNPEKTIVFENNEFLYTYHNI